MKYKFLPPTYNELEEKQHWRHIHGKIFYIEDKKIELPDTIYKYLEIENKLLILISPRSTTENFDYNRNIWCFNEKGEKLWEIESCYDTPELQNPDTVVRSASPYTSITVHDGIVRVFNWSGNLGELDLETGKVTNWQWVG